MRVANSMPALKALVLTTRVLGRYSARLAGVPAYWLWFIPWRVPVSERGLRKQAGWLQATRPFTVPTSVGRIAGFTAGEGPAVLLMHGLGERAAVLGGFIDPLVAAGYKVVGIDLPGHGDSDGQTTNPILMSAAAREVAEHFGGAEAVVAHSLGAAGALWAMDEGLRVQRAVLIAPTADMSFAIEGFQSLFGLPPKAIEGLKRRINQRYGESIWTRLSGVHLVRNNTTPGLVFHDAEDPQVPFAGSERLVRAWQGAELIETPGLGHGHITRDPSVIARAVDFISGASARPERAHAEAVT